MASKLGASLLGRGDALNHSGPQDDVLELDYDADIGAIAQAITPGGHDARPKGAPGGTPFLVSRSRFAAAMQLSPRAAVDRPGASPIPPPGDALPPLCEPGRGRRSERASRLTGGRAAKGRSCPRHQSLLLSQALPLRFQCPRRLRVAVDCASRPAHPARTLARPEADPPALPPAPARSERCFC